jgi:hypothetical protein
MVGKGRTRGAPWRRCRSAIPPVPAVRPSPLSAQLGRPRPRSATTAIRRLQSIPKARMAVILRRRGERVRSTYCGHLARAARQSRNLQEPGSGGDGFQFMFARPEFDRRRVLIGRREQALGTICRIASKGLPCKIDHSCRSHDWGSHDGQDRAPIARVPHVGRLCHSDPDCRHDGWRGWRSFSRGPGRCRRRRGGGRCGHRARRPDWRPIPLSLPPLRLLRQRSLLLVPSLTGVRFRPRVRLHAFARAAGAVFRDD